MIEKETGDRKQPQWPDSDKAWAAFQNPNNINYEYLASNEYRLRIAQRLIAAMRGPKLGFNDEFMSLMADFARFMRGHEKIYGMPYSGKNWMSDFFKWALSQRARTFIRFLREARHPHKKKVLYVLDKIYRLPHPYNSVGGQMFGGMWGWFQTDLRGKAKMKWYCRYRGGRCPTGLKTLPPDLYHRVRFTFDPFKPNYGLRHGLN